MILHNINMPKFGIDNHPKVRTESYEETGFNITVNSSMRRDLFPIRAIYKVNKEFLPSTFLYNDDDLLPIRNQGNCGSCWAFSTAETMGDQYALKTNHKIPLSVEEILECVKTSISDGCNGGAPDEAYRYLENHGLGTEVSNPYKHEFGSETIGSCKLPQSKDFRLYIKDGSIEYIGNSNLVVGSENHKRIIDMMKHAIFSDGPIVGEMKVYQDFMNYDGQTIYHHIDGKLVGGHAIEMIGWHHPNQNKDENSSDYFDKAYWICRNSWGDSWPSNPMENMPNGSFYIRMGHNESDIENYTIVAKIDTGGKHMDSLFDINNKLHKLYKTKKAVVNVVLIILALVLLYFVLRKFKYL